METQMTVAVNEPGIEPVPIDQLIVDSKQPRITRNKKKDEELYLSIKSEGVLQSLLIRPFEGKYMIVCGHRRYEAALKAGITKIPAIIREMTDKQALIKQHSENIHREGVNPMEQAKGFKLLIDSHQMTVSEIATRIGKNEYFVKQQLRLNDLTKKWQHMFYMNAVSMSIALEISTLPEASQEELYKSSVSKDDESSPNPKINIDSYRIKKYKGFLHKAPFDIKDPDLDKKAGACIVCPFNSACSSLFPGDVETPSCSNMACFNKKVQTHLKNEIDKAIQEPGMVLLWDGYNKPPLIEKLKEEGHTVLKCGYDGDCAIITLPEKPEELEFTNNLRRKNKKLTTKQAKEAFTKALKDYEGKVAFVEKRAKDGVYKRGLMVYDNNEVKTGKYFYVELIEKTTRKKAVVINLKDDTVKPEVVQGEIDRINAWYKQSLNTDEKTIQKKIATAFKEKKNNEQVPAKPLACVPTLTNGLLIEMLNYQTLSVAKKGLKIPDLWDSNDQKKYLKALGNLSKQQITFLVRLIVGERYANSLPNTAGGAMFRMLCEEMKEFPIDQIVKEQAVKAKERTKRKDDKINVLKKRKITLESKNKKQPSPQQETQVKKLMPAKKAS
jgi:ParB family chromosome partitioning protein